MSDKQKYTKNIKGKKCIKCRFYSQGKCQLNKDCKSEYEQCTDFAVNKKLLNY